jgi:hypothetical protein
MINMLAGVSDFLPQRRKARKEREIILELQNLAPLRLCGKMFPFELD